MFDNFLPSERLEQIEVKKSRIRETKNLSTDADSRTYAILESLQDLTAKKREKNVHVSFGTPPHF